MEMESTGFDEFLEFFIPNEGSVEGEIPEKKHLERLHLVGLAVLVVLTAIAFFVTQAGVVVFVGSVISLLVLVNGSFTSRIRMVMTGIETKIYHEDGRVTTVAHEQLRLARRLRDGVFEVESSTGELVQFETEKLNGIKDGAHILFRELLIRAALESGQEVKEPKYLAIPKALKPGSILVRYYPVPRRVLFLIAALIGAMLIGVAWIGYAWYGSSGALRMIFQTGFSIALFIWFQRSVTYMWVESIEVQDETLVLHSKRKTATVSLDEIERSRSLRVNSPDRYVLGDSAATLFVLKDSGSGG